MKIKINNLESYNIELPSQVNQKEFLGILSRFNNIAKIISKDSFTALPEDPSTPIPQIKKRKGSPVFLTNRKIAINMFIDYYKTTGTIEKRDIIMENYGKYDIKYESFRGNITAIKAIWKIKPQEVGIQSFPTPGIKRVKLIKDFVKPIMEDEDGM